MKLVNSSYVNDEEDAVVLIFKDETGAFLDTRLVSTRLTRPQFSLLLDEFAQWSVDDQYCEFCNDKLQCNLCKHYEFDIDDFLRFASNYAETEELEDSGIIVYNNLDVNTTLIE